MLILSQLEAFSQRLQSLNKDDEMLAGLGASHCIAGRRTWLPAFCRSRPFSPGEPPELTPSRDMRSLS